MMLLTWLRPNAFDIRTVIYAKHAQHVVLIHFPIALFITAVAFDLIAYWTTSAAPSRTRRTITCWLLRWRQFRSLSPESLHGSCNSKARNSKATYSCICSWGVCQPF